MEEIYDLEEGAFAGAVGPDEGDEFAAADGEGGDVEHPAAGAAVEGDVAQGEQRFAHRPSPPSALLEHCEEGDDAVGDEEEDEGDGHGDVVVAFADFHDGGGGEHSCFAFDVAADHH